MVKDFCLVLDIDETISHTMRLSFGNYFLLRPGVVRLIKKLYNFYEIDIFTAAIKRYADNIVNNSVFCYSVTLAVPPIRAETFLFAPASDHIR